MIPIEKMKLRWETRLADGERIRYDISMDAYKKTVNGVYKPGGFGSVKKLGLRGASALMKDPSIEQ